MNSNQVNAALALAGLGAVMAYVSIALFGDQTPPPSAPTTNAGPPAATAEPFLPAYLEALQGKRQPDTCYARDLRSLLMPCDEPSR